MAKPRYAGIAPERMNVNAPDKDFKLVTGSVKHINTNTIRTAEPFVNLFPIREEVLNSITESMKATGYDQSQPLIMWRQGNVLLDGHTRLQAAKEAEIKTVPVVYASFDNEEDALDYMHRLQFHRRNVKDSELIVLAQNALTKYEKKYGEGSKAEFLTHRFKGISNGKAKKLCIVLEKATEKQLEQIIAEESTITGIYSQLEKRPPKQKVQMNFLSKTKTIRAGTTKETEDEKIAHRPEIYIKNLTVFLKVNGTVPLLTFHKDDSDLKTAVIETLSRFYNNTEGSKL